MDDPAGRLAPLLARLLAATGTAVPAGAVGRILAWLVAVEGWRRRVDLTAARSDAELVDLLVADAAVLACRLPAAARVVDVGSGAGAPGLPLGLLRPDLALTLAEPRQKRAALLRVALGRLAGPDGPPPARLLGERGQELVRRAERFEVALSRAALPPERWLRLGAALAPEGDVWVLLARQEPPSLQGWRCCTDLRYRWPLTGAERRAACFCSAAAATSPGGP
ncbi:MAG: class I SAM-dependent methyltransferase [Deltaproteobacteria bacterium]|nr:class I SAM-dependent methyltransferase [Deltaproteobacteria bacterium]